MAISNKHRRSFDYWVISAIPKVLHDLDYILETQPDLTYEMCSRQYKYKDHFLLNSDVVRSTLIQELYGSERDVES